MGKNLTLEGMSEDEFHEFKRQHLDRGAISQESLLAIRIALELTLPRSPKFKVGCDEMHGHSYNCLDFSDRNSAVYERLASEIKRYQKLLEKLGEEIDKGIGVEKY